MSQSEQELINKKFVVVAFETEGNKSKGCSMDVICSSWLLSNTEAFYPHHLKSVAKCTNAVINFVAPSSNWGKYTVRQLGGSSIFKQISFIILLLLFLNTNKLRMYIL